MATGLKKKSCVLESGQEVFVAKKNYSRKAFVKAGFISDNDNEMDNRAIAAVTTAIKKAKILGKPIAKYDKETDTAYLEYADGWRESVE